MTRGLGTRQTGNPALLAVILFQPGYLRALMELGREDAAREGDDLVRFVRGE